MAQPEHLGRKWNLGRFIHRVFALSLAFSLLSSVHALQPYFVVTQPGASASWANGSPYPFSWSKSMNDGIDSFDVEMTRLSEDGLWLIAQNIPTTYTTLNILLQDVPEGDDYFIICQNASDSSIHGVSSRFSITNSTTSKNPSPDPSVPTVTISGTPNPLKQYAATLGPAVNAGHSLTFYARPSPNPGALGFGGALVVCAVFLGGVMTLW